MSAGKSSNFIAASLSNCTAKVVKKSDNAEHVVVLWNFYVNHWMLLIASILGSLSTFGVLGIAEQCLHSSLVLLQHLLNDEDALNILIEQCRMYILDTRAANSIYLENGREHMLVIDPLITLFERFVQKLFTYKDSSEEELTQFTTLLELLLELMTRKALQCEIANSMMNKFSHSEVPLADQLFMIISHNRSKRAWTRAVVVINRLMDMFVRAIRERHIFDDSDENGNSQKDLSNHNSMKIKQIFDEFDEDKNGRIDKMELRKGLQEMGYSVSNTVADALHSRLDRRRTGAIKFSDLMHFATSEDDLDAETEVPFYCCAVSLPTFS